MNNEIQNIKILGFLKAILKKDYPHYISKDFTSRVMSRLENPIRTTSYLQHGLRIASAVTFAIITLFVMDNVITDKIQYSKSTIEHEMQSPTRNVANPMKKCEHINDDTHPSDSLECK